MSAVLLGRWASGSEEWHAARLPGVSGSEVAPILDISPYSSHYSLWLFKTGRIGPPAESEIMRAGTLLEPVIRDVFRKNHPEYMIDVGGTYRSSERVWQIGNPDGVLLPRVKKSGPRALLEAKYAMREDHWGEPGTDEIPVHYRAQVLWYLDVFDLDTCFVEVFFGSTGRFAEYVVHTHAADQILIRDKARLFLDSVRHDEWPDIDEHSATYDAIKERHPDIETGIECNVPDDMAEQWAEALELNKLAEETYRYAKSRISDHIAAAHRATHNGVTIARRQARNGGTPYLVAASVRKKPAKTLVEIAS